MDKAYCVIEFKELPENYDQVHPFAIVPNSWVSTFCKYGQQGRALVKYPEGQGKRVTDRQVQKFEDYLDSWKTFDGYLHYRIADENSELSLHYAKLYRRLKKRENMLFDSKKPIPSTPDNPKDRDVRKGDYTKPVTNSSNLKRPKDNSKECKSNNNTQDKSSMERLEEKIKRLEADMQSMPAKLTNNVSSTTIQQSLQVNIQANVDINNGRANACNREEREVGRKARVGVNDDPCTIPTKKVSLETVDKVQILSYQHATHRSSHVDTAREVKHEINSNRLIVSLERYTADYKNCRIRLSNEMYERMRTIARDRVRAMFTQN